MEARLRGSCSRRPARAQLPRRVIPRGCYRGFPVDSVQCRSAVARDHLDAVAMPVHHKEHWR